MIELVDPAVDPGPDPDTVIIGASLEIRRAIAIARRFATSHLPILLMGETGTGKELFAQEIHRWSGRSGPLVDVNCGALPRDLVEGELFGARKGAFTGAFVDRSGLIAQAHGGTLFLDELSCLPLEGQIKLLRALETREVRRLGDTAKRAIDFRLVGAVQDGLEHAVREGRFRLDLFQRLAGVVIELPALAARVEDIVLLAAHFAALKSRQLCPGVNRVLLEHHWPGNVRELRMVIERAIVLDEPGDLTVTAQAVAQAIDLGSDCREPKSTRRVMLVQTQSERDALLAAAARVGSDRHKLASELGVSMATLYRRLSRLGISLSHPHGFSRRR